jgi:hypothetical protein
MTTDNPSTQVRDESNVHCVLCHCVLSPPLTSHLTKIFRRRFLVITHSVKQRFYLALIKKFSLSLKMLVVTGEEETTTLSFQATTTLPSSTSNDGGYNGRLKATETHIHLSKNGLYYPSYQEMCDANHRSNQRHLKSMGLLDGPLLQKSVSRPSSSKKTAIRKKSTPHKAGQTVAAPIRRSGRLRKEEPVGPAATIFMNGCSSSDLFLDDLEREIRVPANKRKKPSPRSSKQQQKESTTPLTAAQREKLSNLFPNCSWLQGLETYLLKEDQISHANFRNVMRQAEKFATGQGITYPKHWGHVAFAKSECIDMTCDLDALHARAVDHEDEYGRDLGNGWLLRHPITKMRNFQSYCLEKAAEEQV